jgi:hypothetical protein
MAGVLCGHKLTHMLDEGDHGTDEHESGGEELEVVRVSTSAAPAAKL